MPVINTCSISSEIYQNCPSSCVVPLKFFQSFHLTATSEPNTLIIFSCSLYFSAVLTFGSRYLPIWHLSHFSSVTLFEHVTSSIWISSSLFYSFIFPSLTSIFQEIRMLKIISKTKFLFSIQSVLLIGANISSSKTKFLGGTDFFFFTLGQVPIRNNSFNY